MCPIYDVDGEDNLDISNFGRIIPEDICVSLQNEIKLNRLVLQAGTPVFISNLHSHCSLLSLYCNLMSGSLGWPLAMPV